MVTRRRRRRPRRPEGEAGGLAGGAGVLLAGRPSPYGVDTLIPPGRGGQRRRAGGGILGEMASRGAPGSAAGPVPGPAAVRALPLDEYAALLLSLGRYRVDPATGAVVGPQGRPMVPQRNAETGYSHVLLSIPRWRGG